MVRLFSLKAMLAGGLSLALLLLPALVSVAQTDSPAPLDAAARSNRVTAAIKRQRVSFWADRIPIAAAMRSLCAVVQADAIIDPAVTGTISVNFQDVSFEEALRAFREGADQPISCSRDGDAFLVRLRSQTEKQTFSNRVGMIDLPPEMKPAEKAAESSSAKKQATISLPFVCTTPDGSFQENASRAIDPYTEAAPIPGTITMFHNLLMDGTVIIRMLKPDKILSVSHGGEWTLSSGEKCGVLNLSPVFRVFMDRASETVEVRKGVVTIQDKKGHSVTIYPYSKTPG